MTGADQAGYAEAQVQRLLTEHTGVAEQGITVNRYADVIVLRGEVASTQRRDEILRVVAAHFPGSEVHLDIAVTRTDPPAGAEDLT